MLIGPLVYLSFIVFLRGNAVTSAVTHTAVVTGPTDTDITQFNARKAPNIDDLVAQWRTAVAQWRIAVAQLRTAVHSFARLWHSCALLWHSCALLWHSCALLCTRSLLQLLIQLVFSPNSVTTQVQCEISGFLRDVNEIFALNEVTQP